jgi:type II secretory pathway component PulJ
MNKVFGALLLLAMTATISVAQTSGQESEQQTKEDIARHRAMAIAHEAAAKCLESGKKQDICLKELQAACKGLAIGKFCGMKHEH